VRTHDHLDLFTCSTDGRVYTLAISFGLSDFKADWRSPGATVSTLTRRSQQQDLFLCDKEGCIYTSWWSSGEDWSPINGARWEASSHLEPRYLHSRVRQITSTCSFVASTDVSIRRIGQESLGGFASLTIGRHSVGFSRLAQKFLCWRVSRASWTYSSVVQMGASTHHVGALAWSGQQSKITGTPLVAPSYLERRCPCCHTHKTSSKCSPAVRMDMYMRLTGTKNLRGGQVIEMVGCK